MQFQRNFELLWYEGIREKRRIKEEKDRWKKWQFSDREFLSFGNFLKDCKFDWFNSGRDYFLKSHNPENIFQEIKQLRDFISSPMQALEICAQFYFFREL